LRDNLAAQWVKAVMMTDGDGEGLERFFRPRYPVGDDTPPDIPAPPPGSDQAPSAPPPRSPSPRRRVTPSPAQQRLMARIAASRKARQKRALLTASGVLSALVLLVAGGAWALTGFVSGSVGRVDAGTAGTPPAGPLNILVAGVDTRSGLNHHQQAELHVGTDTGANSDSMMVVHVSADHTKMTVVSLPRDTWLNIPGHGMNKLNAAYGMGGPKLVVQTVEQATGLTIDDYAGVNFLGVVKVVDALGGVNVCLPQALDDPDSGLDLPAGLHHVNGITALKYARDRHSFADEDLTRMGDQQRLLASLLKEAISGGTLANPARFTRFLNASLAVVQVDRSLNVTALANQMRGISTDNVAFTTVPLSNAGYQAPDGQSAVLWDPQAANHLFSDLAEDKPLVKPAPKPGQAKSPASHRGQVTVEVYNGTLVSGLSASTGAQLSQLGFHVSAKGNWSQHNVTRTMIQYSPGQQAEARLVQSSLPGATLVQRPGLPGPRVVLGTDGSELASARQPGAPASTGSGSSGSGTGGSATSGSGTGGSGTGGSGADGTGPVKAKTATQNACG
jgi:LCP family protein required for cell wall assembly